MINYEDEDDMKNNNIIKGKIKIIDFSVASYLKKGEVSRLIVGHPLYMSPIMLGIDKDKDYDEKEDIWSLGVTCYILLTGNFPFERYQNNLNRENYYVPTTL